MEKSFRKKLFRRTPKGLSLTEDGRSLFEHTKLIFEEGSRVLEKFSDEDIGGYPVNIGIEDKFFNEIAIDFSSKYWDIYAPFGTVNTVKQHQYELLIESLISENIDWGISYRVPKRKGLSYAEIGSFELLFCCAKDLYDKFIDEKDLLINIPFAESTWDKDLNKAILKHLRLSGVSPKERIFSDHPEFIKNLCQRGRCVMMTPKNPLRKYDGLKTFYVEKPIKVSLYAIWKEKDEELISIKKLKDLIYSNFSQLPERYQDIELQIEASDVSESLLN